MQISATPLKWTIPFATNDSAKVEVPATTADPTRFSLSLGSPPLTGQPPETGGVPPQLEDFNGAINQIARFTWWQMGGGPLPYDPTWSADPNVNGYANGAAISTADGLGDWISVADNNTVNPDTTGTNWVPGYVYGRLSLTGQTGGTVTLTPAQASKRLMSISGTLTSNLTIVVPTWLYEWTVTNTTSGAFTVTVKTAAGSGVTIPQDSAPTRVRGDGTNVTQLSENIAAATQPTQPPQLQQMTGRLIGVQVFGTAGTSVYTPTTGTTKCRVTVIAGGGSGGGATATTSGQLAVGGGGGGGGYSIGLFPVASLAGQTVTVGAGGVAAAGVGNSGGNSSIGSVLTAIGGFGGSFGSAGVATIVQAGGVGGTGGVGGYVAGAGGSGQPAIGFTTANFVSGAGGSSLYTGGGQGRASTTGNGLGPAGPGCGSGGAASANGTGGFTSAAGAAGLVLIEEYF